jgi:hypothetical protein
MLAAVVVLLTLAASGLAFHAFAQSPSVKRRTYGLWLVAAAFSLMSVVILAPFYTQDPDRILTTYILPQLLLSGLIFGEGALLSRWLVTKVQRRWRFMTAYAVFLTLIGGFTIVVFVSAYPGS